jgi:hypothetical protein
LAAGTNLICQADFCDREMLKKVTLHFKDGVPLNLKIKYPGSMFKEGLSIDATFNPP